MFKQLFKRQNLIGLLLLIAVALLIGRLGNLTVIHGEEYAEKAINNRIKKISVVAKRGEIFDRNGEVLAGNQPAFTVQFMTDGLDQETLNRVSVALLELLDSQGESHIDFPIALKENELVYSHDEKIMNWLLDNGYDRYLSAQTVFENVRTREQISETLDVYETQDFLLMKGISLPISVRTMKYLDEMRKEDFLKSYDLPVDAPIDDAFAAVRNLSSYGIDQEWSDEDALKVLAVRYALKLQGYIAYEPIEVASSVSEETAVLIREMGMDFPGVNIEVEPIRDYPSGSLAAHVLGYLGKISSESEITRYIESLGYDRNDMIGKTGLENVYETTLAGQDGYRYIEVDAYGRYVKAADPSYSGLESVEPVAGGSLTLTLDKTLQETMEASLEKWLAAIREGGTHEDGWGNVTYDAFPKALSGSAVAVDVKTGEVLALANYPSYDPNLFATGISEEDWLALSPDNPKNPLAARPLYNTAALTAVQPGSTFKMLTAIAAIGQGLDPEMKLYADGYVEVGNNSFGCWLWNDYHARHGLIDLAGALEVSCNYYFFDLAAGMDYRNDQPLGIEMNAEILTDYARLLGLDGPSGVEIPEVVRGVPDVEKKTNTILWGLRIKLGDVLDDYFPPAVIADDDRRQAIIDTIVSWADENPSRAQIIRDLIDLGTYEVYSQVEELADIIKYDYFNRIGWFEGDLLNMAIGQGDHLYTPLQMVRYVMGIANDGYLHELSLVKAVDGVETASRQAEVPLFEGTDTFEAVRKGMYEVAQGDSGTARSYFAKFPVDVGAKTGTAEKEGKIPPADEVAYLTENLKLIDPSLSEDAVMHRAQEILVERNEELAAYERQKDSLTDETEIARLESKITGLVAEEYLTLGSSLREAIKEVSNLELTDTIINQYRDDYDSYAWFVGFAPYDAPEIAVVVFIPQGGHGGYAAPIARDIIAAYLGLQPEGITP